MRSEHRSRTAPSEDKDQNLLPHRLTSAHFRCRHKERQDRRQSQDIGAPIPMPRANESSPEARQAHLSPPVRRHHCKLTPPEHRDPLPDEATSEELPVYVGPERQRP